jgi:hypothetical protein
MLNRFGALGLRAAAALVALGVAALLWHRTGALDYLIFCWPSSPGAQAWKIDRLVTYAALVPTVALPVGATLSSRRAPRVSSMLAAAAIVVLPLLYLVLAQLAPEWPR